jgi:signal peptidase
LGKEGSKKDGTVRLVKNILFWLTTVVLVVVVASIVATRLMGVGFFAVATGSMTPDIPVGSLVVVVPTEAEDIKVGDDITFVTKGDVVVTHRVIAIDREANEFTTWGIANARNATDAPSRYENIIGVVRLKIPGAGMLFTWLSTLQGKIVAATGIIALYLLYSILSVLTKEKRKEPDEPEAQVQGGRPPGQAPPL